MPSENDAKGGEGSARSSEQAAPFSERQLRDHVPPELRNVDFPFSVRGYDRAAVDAYVKRVNHLIAELEVSRSPRSAVRHALDSATEEVSGILQRAQETADEIVASARKEAEESAARTSAQAAKVLVDANDQADRIRADAEKALTAAKTEAENTLANARAEAEELLGRARSEGNERLQRSEKELEVLRELAEARMRDLQADTDTVWEERRELLDDISGMAARLTELSGEAASRFPSREPEQVGVPEVVEPEANGVEESDATTRTLAEAGLGTERGDQPSDEAASR